MVSTYSSISPSLDKRAIKIVLKTIMAIALIVILIAEVYRTIVLGEAARADLWWYVGTIVPAGAYSFIQIMGYSKQDILRIAQPGGLELGLSDTIKTILSHPIELIIVPMFTAVMLYLGLSTAWGSGIAPQSIIFVMIYLVQLLPINLKKEMYTRIAHQAIDGAKDEIKTSRIIMTTMEIPLQERERALSRHISAEEMISVHSEFLICSTGIKTMLITGTRFLFPVFSALGGMIFDIVMRGM